MPKRLFFGIELPAHCREILARLDPQLKGVRWGRLEQFHLTLTFLGDLDREQEERLRTAVADVKVARFFLPIRGVGTFGGARPSVLWAGVGKGHPHLFALHKHLLDAVLNAGLRADLRRFHPHITLARPSGVSEAALRPFLREHAETEFGMWEVQEFVLFSSRPALEGSTYTAELRQSLL
ncbi:MAG TPA: RNA 2',3'-cyclic phosphodiesterase [Chthoniobacteraceae bacterium]|jgi:2'-5' RNA ligase